MGMQAEPAELVRNLARRSGFSVCELGDQYTLHKDRKTLSRDWFLELGAGRYEAIDGNGRGTIEADLNKPLLMAVGQFDLVTDFGTGEHIFDQAQVWKTLHNLCKVGGHIIVDRPSEGYYGHCFYLINEGLIRDIAEANDYHLKTLWERKTPRGKLICGLMEKTVDAPFKVPNQSRYRKILKI